MRVSGSIKVGDARGAEGVRGSYAKEAALEEQAIRFESRAA